MTEKRQPRAAASRLDGGQFNDCPLEESGIAAACALHQSEAETRRLVALVEKLAWHMLHCRGCHQRRGQRHAPGCYVADILGVR